MTAYKIVILKCKAQSLTSVEQFLAHRDWQVYSAANLKAAISSIIKVKPDFVFIAIDHGNKKVKLLPRLLSQALKVPVIGFIESTTPQAMQALNELKLDYVLFPPLSGPSIERLIHRMKKDEQRQLEQAEKNASRGELLDDSTQIEEDDETPSVAVSKGAPKKAKGMYHFTGEKKKDLGNITEQGIKARQLLEQLLSEEAQTDTTSNEPVLVAKDPTKDITQEGLAEADPFAAEWKSKEEAAARGFDEEDSPAPRSNEPVDFIKKGFAKAENLVSKPREKKSKMKIEDHSQTPAPSESDSILVRGAHEALDQSIQKVEGLQEYEALTSSSRVACIIVDSPRFSGYLVAAMGEDRDIDESFIGSIKTRLVEFLRKHGEVIKDEEAGMDLKIEQVDFEAWSLDQAEFLRKSIHGANEVAMAFFPSPETQVRLEQSANENMLQMDIAELQDDIAVEFDMYIYMPTNNRYLLYTPQGRKLAGQQRGRLIDKGIQKIHLRKESEGQVKKYRAQIFLNEKIQAYKTGGKSKKTGS